MFSEKTVYEHLTKLGVPANLKGYRALVHSVIFASTDPPPASMTKDVYPHTARMLETTASRVERSIRHAIERVFDQTDAEVLQEYFGNVPGIHKGKLTNSEFIYGLVEYIKQKG